MSTIEKGFLSGLIIATGAMVVHPSYVPFMAIIVMSTGFILWKENP